MKSGLYVLIPLLLIVFTVPMFLWSDSSFAGGPKAKEDDLDTLIRRVEEVEREAARTRLKVEEVERVLVPTREVASKVERAILSCTSDGMLCDLNADCCSNNCTAEGECAELLPACIVHANECDPTIPCCAGLGCSTNWDSCFVSCTTQDDCTFGYFCVNNTCDPVP